MSFEMTLRISENTCLGDLREFLEAADKIGTISEAQPISHFDEHDELDGLAIVVGGGNGR